jgi:hypothetical protein
MLLTSERDNVSERTGAVVSLKNHAVHDTTLARDERRSTENPRVTCASG